MIENVILADPLTLSAMRGLTLALLLLAAWASPANPWGPSCGGRALGYLRRAGYLLMAGGYLIVILDRSVPLTLSGFLLHLGTWVVCLVQVLRRGRSLGN